MFPDLVTMFEPVPVWGPVVVGGEVRPPPLEPDPLGREEDEEGSEKHRGGFGDLAESIKTMRHRVSHTIARTIEKTTYNIENTTAVTVRMMARIMVTIQHSHLLQQRHHQ
ncbi:MAG: hypothetical protein M3R02_01485 [Chloroflexota bacterium]|nr:hypothetical protein [Chloroflexota bacterium]